LDEQVAFLPDIQGHVAPIEAIAALRVGAKINQSPYEARMHGIEAQILQIDWTGVCWRTA
jgi:hypothetical protein